MRTPLLYLTFALESNNGVLPCTAVASDQASLVIRKVHTYCFSVAGYLKTIASSWSLAMWSDIDQSEQRGDMARLTDRRTDGRTDEMSNGATRRPVHRTARSPGVYGNVGQWSLFTLLYLWPSALFSLSALPPHLRLPDTRLYNKYRYELQHVHRTRTILF